MNGCASLKVSDTGAGIEPGFLPHVFDRFSQADTTNTRLYGGLGLGLAIVRHLVEQHGGMIQADSPGPGKGATFSVTLPLMNVQRVVANGGAIVFPAGAKYVPRGHHHITDLRVLVVDDDVPTLEAISEVLREMGADVKVAHSAAEAMIAVEEFHPQLLLCDIAMPGEDGYDFIRRLRALGVDGGGGMPALALTALATDDDHQRSLAAGFQMHLSKPVDIDRLSAAVVELAARPLRERMSMAVLDESPGAREGGDGDLDTAALFAIVWDAIAEVLGTAATAAIVRRAAGRAATDSPELVDVVIRREKLEYRYTLPHAWSHAARPATPGSGRTSRSARWSPRSGGCWWS